MACDFLLALFRRVRLEETRRASDSIGTIERVIV
jgi:hypothetical protein